MLPGAGRFQEAGVTRLRAVVSSLAAGAFLLGVSGAAPALAQSPYPQGHNAAPPFRVKQIGQLPDGSPKLAASRPSGLPPSQVQSVYKLSGLAASSKAGTGQVIAIVDAYHDPHVLTDLNAWNAEYGYPQVSACSSVNSNGPCLFQADPQGTPSVNSGWVLEESLDVEWAHAEAPGAKIVLVEAASASISNLFSAVSYANGIGATEVSMSWGAGEFSGETAYDSVMAQVGTFYTVSSGDSGHGTEYPSASPKVIAVGGTTLNGCAGTSCAGFTGESAWSGSGGGISSTEALPGDQSSYSGPVFGASTIGGLTGGRRGVPDVSFDANPNTGVSVYDSTKYQGQHGWFTLGGTSVGAPNWAGILAAGRAAGAIALEGAAAIYGGGYRTNLRDIASGSNGSCGTDCTAGAGYDLVTGLGSPVNYP